jgi:hypothetical protein
VRPIAGEQVGVPLVPGQVLLLGAAGLALAVGGPVGLLTGELGRGRGEGVLVAGRGQLAAAQQPPGPLTQLDHPVAGRLLTGGRVGQPLLSDLALLGGADQQPADCRSGHRGAGRRPGRARRAAPACSSGAGPAARRCRCQALGAVPAGDGGEPVADAAGFGAGHVKLQLDRPGLGANDVEEGPPPSGARGLFCCQGLTELSGGPTL